MPSSKSIVRYLVLCGVFSALSIMVNQYAIQLESDIRNTQLDLDKKRLIISSMRSFESKNINVELSILNFYHSIQSRFMAIKNPKLNFLAKGICSEGRLVNRNNVPECENFHDSDELIENDLNDFLKIISYEMNSSFNDLIMIAGEIEGTRTLLGEFTNKQDEFIKTISDKSTPNSIFNEDEILREGIIKLSELRMLVNEKTKDMDQDYTNTDETLVNLMNFRQKLLLSAVLLQLISLVFLLIFFKLYISNYYHQD